MERLIPFEYKEKTVRVVMVDGEPRFVAKDVCEVLEISKYRDAVAKLDDDERMSITVDTPGGPQKMTAVNEPGLYKLIFTSHKSEAKSFQRWVTHEVLPSIRKTGRYEVPGRKVGNDQTEQLKVRRIAIMEMNAKTRQAKLLFDTARQFRDRLSDKAIESVLAVGAKLLTGLELIPLPVTERMYTAADIAEEAGVSANMVGRIANRHSLKTSEYGQYVLDKSPHSAKQVSAFRYNERGREKLLGILRRKLAQEEEEWPLCH
ncbi:Bro-N domain-containing protein [Alicyclobacillus macrosporangiidus]|uniref:BRO-N domain-containing protein n=1 Tax=Alicyclobacillus macrosporangiidus TaxID=392015 RepID=UPI000553EC8B|nr:BRO family protein [Alicyclobacillus macrosporangiidus]